MSMATAVHLRTCALCEAMCGLQVHVEVDNDANLGALGDGGAVITSDRAIAERVKRLRNGGQSDRYVHVEAGINSRLDELQAAVLRARLTQLPAWTQRRRELASEYRRSLPGGVQPVAERDPGHVYHLFPVRTSGRQALQTSLAAAGIETLIHYPMPLHEQPFASELNGRRTRDCQVASRAARELLSLPLHPRLTDGDLRAVVAAVRNMDRRDVPA